MVITSQVRASKAERAPSYYVYRASGSPASIPRTCDVITGIVYFKGYK